MAWTAFAFAGVYPATLVIPALLTLLLAATYHPRILRHGPHRRLDLWLLLSLAAAAIQIIPLPRLALEFLSPEAVRVAGELSLAHAGTVLPISIDVADSAAAVVLFGGMTLFFFTARRIFAAGGVRSVARGIAVIGLALAAVAIAQEATGAGQMYWRWKPIFQRTDPFGPFVNRNHFGTWGIMAIPLTIGYLIAHVAARPHPEVSMSWRKRVVGALDGRAALLLAATAVMLLGVVLSLSRSAMLGLGSALLLGGWLSYRRAIVAGVGRARPALAVGVLALLAGALIVIRVPPSQVIDRVSGVPVAFQDRVAIWRATIPVIQDFWLTGTGVGTYQTSMAIYQRSDRGLIYNQAHNHYLQVASEGGLLLGIPVAIALLLFAGICRAALARDRSGVYWLRAGGASGLVGVAVQSLLETGLLTPANGLLAAVIAAAAVHQTPNSKRQTPNSKRQTPKDERGLTAD